jgi:hypothetical protein
MMLLRIHLSLVIIASSYLTLGLTNIDRAEDLLLPYAVVTLALAGLSLWREWHCHDRTPHRPRH